MFDQWKIRDRRWTGPRSGAVGLFWFWMLVNPAITSSARADGERRFAHSDSDKRYLHYIDLYDANNRKITPESDQPYSPKNTCGRCHDYETISHGWHFNAFRSHAMKVRSTPSTDKDAGEPVQDGRRGEPWIWTDARTGTQLPLSYRNWDRVFHPAEIGLDEFAMARHFGGRIPGGSFASQEERGESQQPDAPEGPTGENPVARWNLSGDLEVDCMACHAVSGQYDFEHRRDTIQQENFAWAPTAALRLGVIRGSVARIKDGSDPADAAIAAKLPTVAYDANRFQPDQTVFIDLVRVPDNNSCYQCHSQRTVDSQGIQPRWIHDQDVHLRAGMKCVDCHRNGIDHHIVRGFEGDPYQSRDPHGSGESVATLSCVGCHLGTDPLSGSTPIADRPGRLGAPVPRHEGLPPIHFEKMTCTACHSGPIPEMRAGGMMTSLSHGLGEKAHRDGSELPSISGPVFLPNDSTHDARVSAARVMWPSYWGQVRDGDVQPLPPDAVHDVTRRALRVRRDFLSELTDVKITAQSRLEILGPLRGELDDDALNDSERQKLDDFRFREGRKQFDQKIHAALESLEKELGIDQAVFVCAGTVFARGTTVETLDEIEVGNPEAIQMVHWPLAHNVRPAGWSLGATGCLECHQDEAVLFAGTVTPTGPAPLRPDPITMASLQGIDEPTRLLWNQLFGGRALFKILSAASLVALALLFLMGLSISAMTHAKTVIHPKGQET